MVQLGLEYINGTPVFVTPDARDVFSRVHAGIFDKELQRWRYPAYPPFGQLVIADLRKVIPDLAFTKEAQERIAFLNTVNDLVANRTLPENFEYVTKPFDHQIEGLAHLYHHPRFALFWDPGTGKSKVVIDLLRLLSGKRALILTPKVTVMNWVKEINTHAGSALKVGVIYGTPVQKRKVIHEYKKYDVLIASYGTARNMGLPRLNKATLGHIQAAQKAGVPLSTSGLTYLVRTIRRVADPERQAAYVLAWAFGMPLSHVDKHTEAEAQQNPNWLEDIDYDILACDESHNIKAGTSQQTKVVLELSKKAGRRYLLSGTPTLGDPRHLYTQMKFLSPAIIPEDWLKFSDMFLLRSAYNKHMVTGFKNMNILNTRVQRVAIRKRKEECLDLPPRQIIDLPFKLSAEQTKLYNTLVNAMEVDLSAFFDNPDTSPLEVQNAAVLLNKLAQVSSGFLIDGQKKADFCNGCQYLNDCVANQIRPYTRRCKVVQEAPPAIIYQLKENPKLEALEELLDTLLDDPTHKVIIWGIHKAELQNISELLDKRKWKHVRVQGGTGGNIQTLIDRFNEDPQYRVYLGQIATGVGITLNAAAYTVYSSVDWSLGTYEQSIDRNYRAGQTKSTVVYRLLGEGTVDTYKSKALDEKKDISATLMNKLACTSCDKRFECLSNNIALFDAGCIYQRRATRTIAHAQEIV